VLFITTAIVAAAFGVLAAHAHVVVRAGFDVGDNVPGEAFGAAGFVAAVLSVISPLLAAVILLALATALASRRFGERGAIELWAAWGAGLGLAVAVYIDPVEVSRGIGGFGVVLVGATAILALLHPAASLGARRRLAVWPRCRVPVISALAVWIGVAWCAAPADRNHVGTVAAASRPEPLSAAVAEWLERQTADPVGTEDDPYVPMLLVAASGGGSKAAYWTDLVLDCAFGRPVGDAGGR
jgi:hypothetical protein